MAKQIRLLTAGSDCAGMNAAIRGIGKAVSAEKTWNSLVSGTALTGWWKTARWSWAAGCSLGF